MTRDAHVPSEEEGVGLFTPERRVEAGRIVMWAS